MTITAPSSDYGRRLVPLLLDEGAILDPSRAYASVPIDELDLSKGFKDITVKQVANAVNKASWWLEEQLGHSMPGVFETIAYFGPRDLRYVCLQIAAMKVGRKVSYTFVVLFLFVLTEEYGRFSCLPSWRI
jgi:hypothetical protein